MNLVAQIESALARTQRQAVVDVLRQHPEWPLGILLTCGPRARVLAEITVGDLLNDQGRERLQEAKDASGSDFDMFVLEAIREAGKPVGASYLTKCVGGPRWKLLDSLHRLVGSGAVRRHGATSGTRYEVIVVK